jgi:ribonucleoside-diphosphate reductase alpha chain
MLDKTRMPETRQSLTRKVIAGGLKMYITVGFYENSQPGEIFIVAAKQGSTLGGLLDDVARLMSTLLQFGVTMDQLYDRMHGARYEPRDDTYSSPIDAVVKNALELVKEYGGDPSLPGDLAQVQKSDPPPG